MANYRKLLSIYKNGNYSVAIYSDGTKLRYTKDNEFIADFPENIDLKITDYCDLTCPYCHEDSTKKGLHGNVNAKFLDTLRPFTELAIGGGNPLSYPYLYDFLVGMRDKYILCNLTVNQVHFEKNFNFIKMLSENELVKGIGISVLNPSKKLLTLSKQIDNTVFHTIAGIQTVEDFYALEGKVLVLGYKNFRRGATYKNKHIDKKIDELREHIVTLSEKFKVLSFDNLALEQLNVQGLFPKDVWDMFYMGNDGQHTMYIDLVKQRFAKNSTSEKTYGLLDNIDDMFNTVRRE